MAEIANILRDLLKPDIVVDVNKQVTNPFDLLQLQVQLNQTSDTVCHRIDRRSGHRRKSRTRTRLPGWEAEGNRFPRWSSDESH